MFKTSSKDTFGQSYTLSTRRMSRSVIPLLILMNASQTLPPETENPHGVTSKNSKGKEKEVQNTKKSRHVCGEKKKQPVALFRPRR